MGKRDVTSTWASPSILELFISFIILAISSGGTVGCQSPRRTSTSTGTWPNCQSSICLAMVSVPKFMPEKKVEANAMVSKSAEKDFREPPRKRPLKK